MKLEELSDIWYKVPAFREVGPAWRNCWTWQVTSTREANQCLSFGRALHAAAAAAAAAAGRPLSWFASCCLLSCLSVDYLAELMHSMSTDFTNSPCCIPFFHCPGPSAKWQVRIWHQEWWWSCGRQAPSTCSLVGLEQQNPSPLHATLISILYPYAFSDLLLLPISTMKVLPSFQMIIRSPLLWKPALCLSSTPCLLDAFTVLNEEWNWLAPQSKAEDAQG